MRRLSRLAVLGMAMSALMGALTLAVYPSASAAEVVSAREAKIATRVFDSIEDGKWNTAKRAARGLRHPLLIKTYRWRFLSSPDSGASFQEIAQFIRENQDWPDQWLLLMRAEEAMTTGVSDDEVLEWFADREPRTADGGSRLARAFLANGEIEKARAVIRKTWVEANFGSVQERHFYNRFRRYLTREDHIERLDRLLWAGRYYPSRRMYRRVHKSWALLAEARLALRRMVGGVDGAIARVPEHLRDHPGLVYERLRWRRRKGRDKDAIELLANMPADLVRPDLWSHERAILARRALQDGHISEAYILAKNHGMEDGIGLVEGEWLAGWIALRFLKEPTTAFSHFTRIYRAANYAISRSRGAYWAGRAAEEMKEQVRARFWYRTASNYPMTYYGQLAAARYFPDGNLRVPPDPKLKDADKKSFAKHELVVLVKLLSDAGLTKYIDPFIEQLNEIGATPAWRAQVAELAEIGGRQDLAVQTAKKAIREGAHLLGAGFPTLDAELKTDLETPLVHALIRQESAFNNEAVSHAGARGLMQLMPGTAKLVARQLRVPYRRNKLTQDEEYNISLGTAYLRDMLRTFDGSYVQAIAAYNAGPARVRRWVKEYGDPSDPSIDPIDWVEMIPLSETRNYVQRVMENLHVYRLRLADSELAFNPESDLRR